MYEPKTEQGSTADTCINHECCILKRDKISDESKEISIGKRYDWGLY